MNTSVSGKNYSRRTLLFTSAILGLSGSIALADDWAVIRMNDHSYVTLANVGHFYQLPQFSRTNGLISLRSDRRVICAQSASGEFSINGLRFFADFPLLKRGDDDLVSVTDLNKIIEPVLRPSRIPRSESIETVILDPGHGGVDSGALSSWGAEKEFALDVALAARKELIQAGYRVEMTRTSDVAVSLEDRVAFANGFAHAVFVSIHFNWSPGGAGIESYALAPEGVPSNASSEHDASATGMGRHPGNLLDPQNIALTAAIHASVLSRLSLLDRGVRHARFHVLRNIRVPAVLLEGGFISDPAEGQRIATGQYRQQLAAAIAQGVHNYDVAVNYKTAKNIAVAKTNPVPSVSSNNQPPASDKQSAPASIDSNESREH